MLIYCIWWFYTYFRHLCAESLGVIFGSVFVECTINTLITLICVFKYCCTLFGFHKNTCSCFITFGRSVVMKSIEAERCFAGLNHGYILSLMSVHLGQSSHNVSNFLYTVIANNTLTVLLLRNSSRQTQCLLGYFIERVCEACRF